MENLIEESEARITPLHLAKDGGNNRSISILLKYMARVHCNTSDNISDILPELVESQNFIMYMDNLP